MNAKELGNMPAYPEQLIKDADGIFNRASAYVDCGGLTKREAFAMAAMPAIVAATSAGQHSAGKGNEGYSIERRIAVDAFAIADAMLAESAKGQP